MWVKQANKSRIIDEKQTMSFTTLHFPFALILLSSKMKNDIMSQRSLMPSS